MKVKRLLGLIVVLVVFISTFPIANALEIAELDKAKIVQFRWNITSGSIYTMKVSNSLPTSDVNCGHVTSAVSGIDSQAPSNISVTNTSFSSSLVDVWQPSSNYWDVNNLDGTAYACTVLISDTGTVYYTYDQMPYSGRVRVNAGLVCCNPDPANASPPNESTRIIMHELLHCFGMGHNNFDSLLDGWWNPTSTYLPTYDFGEFLRMYP